MYYRMRTDGTDGIECVGGSEFPGSTYTDKEIVQDYLGRWVFEEDITDNEEYEAEKAEYESEARMNRIRGDREKKCFSVINRGQFWFDTLTEEQTAELKEWYQEWLDAPQTLTEPDTPDWLT
ncbi:MAG: hypothetical protein LUE27_05430 [Clostridia bacterium]|nr:hypothetical protein [Clostridia bacterium]